MITWNLQLAGSVSFAQVSFSILKELARRDEKICLELIAGIDLSPYDVSPELHTYIKKSLNNSRTKTSRTQPCFKLWHIQNSIPSFSGNGNNLITFHETSALTDIEVNILKQQNKVFVTSNFTKSVFAEYDIDAIYLPLGFDNEQFFNKPRINTNESINFGLFGKFEKRKNTGRLLNLWAKKYGNNPKYRLVCLIHNPFLKPEQNNQLIGQALEGKQYYNISFLPPLKTNKEVLDVHNYIDINISGLSACEGFGMDTFISTCLGKETVYLDAHAFKDYASAENSTLVESTHQIPAEDGMWFVRGQDFNQGNWFETDDAKIIEGFEKAESKIKEKNEAGIQLGKDRTWAKTVDVLLENI